MADSLDNSLRDESGSADSSIDLSELDQALTQAQIISNVAAIDHDESEHDTVADNALRTLKAALVAADIAEVDAERLITQSMERMEAATMAGAAVRASRENDWYVLFPCKMVNPLTLTQADMGQRDG
jgi:predicted phage tail protein